MPATNAHLDIEELRQRIDDILTRQRLLSAELEEVRRRMEQAVTQKTSG